MHRWKPQKSATAYYSSIARLEATRDIFLSMLYKLACERWMQSKGFLEDQFILEKVTLEKVNGLCLKLEDADEFKHCTSTLKHYRKSYRVMLQALL